MKCGQKILFHCPIPKHRSQLSIVVSYVPTIDIHRPYLVTTTCLINLLCTYIVTALTFFTYLGGVRGGRRRRVFKRIVNQGVTLVTRLWVSMTKSLRVSNWMVHSWVLGHIILYRMVSQLDVIPMTMCPNKPTNQLG